MERWLAANGAVEGWEVNPSLRSQGSIGRDTEGGVVLNYRLQRWVESEAVTA
jgi:hypothetical protein